MRQRPLAQPIEPRVALGAIENIGNAVQSPCFAHARSHAQQMNVMVAQHHPRPRAQIAHLAQHAQIIRTAIDQVTAKPHIGIRRNLLE